MSNFAVSLKMKIKYKKIKKYINFARVEIIFLSEFLRFYKNISIISFLGICWVYLDPI